jgi:Putative auto-transporter adhesin, head GIN domain
MTKIQTTVRGSITSSVRFAGLACALCLGLAITTPAQAADKTDKADKETYNSWNWNFNWNGNVTKGSGKVATDKRALTGYDALALKGSFDVRLAQGANEGLEVLADDNLLPLIETRVDGSTLVVTAKKGASFSTRNPIVVNVTVKNIKAIAISGSGDILGAALKTDALAISISGSGNVKMDNLTSETLSVGIAGSGDFTANGNAKQQTISISGSGDVRTDKLEGLDVIVKIAGSGDASVWAKNTLLASIAGSGDIRYKGDAKVTQKVAGSGSVSKM